MSDILSRIAKVLALAESTDNEHEADAFMKKAQSLATEHSIEMAVARRHVAKSQQRETPTMVDNVEVAESELVGTALILADKRAEVSDFYSKTSDARGSWRGGRAKVATPNSARAAGRKAGNNARLSAVPTLPGSKKAIA